MAKANTLYPILETLQLKNLIKFYEFECKIY